MAITTRDGLIAALASSTTGRYTKTSITTVAGRGFSLFRVAGSPVGGAAPATVAGAAVSRTTQGAILIPAPSNVTYLAGFRASMTTIAALWVYDRLVETGALSGIVTTAQTVGSAALPARGGTGVGVELWLEVYTALGATPSPTVTASYTNTAGTAGRTATLIGGIPASVAANTTLGPFALQAGDTGVQSVQSVTSTTSTATAGAFGITLRRSLAVGIPGGANSSSNGFTLGYADLALPIVPDDACLELVAVAGGTALGTIIGSVDTAQG